MVCIFGSDFCILTGMNRKARYIFVVILIVFSTAMIIGYRVWNKPHSKVEDVESIKVTADGLSKAFAADESKANQQYLNKAIEVTGSVSEVIENQDGGTMLVLQTEDPMMGIQCTMREGKGPAEIGKSVTIKGFCSGSGITGVSLTDCILK